MIERDDNLETLRRDDWSDPMLAVVVAPISAVELGYDCPSLQRLDEIVDFAIATKQVLEGAPHEHQD
jgi:hypothetical protein